MSIKALQITKLYGTQKALDNFSVEIRSGEVVGLLGPNGAGKSTLMKILTCFLPPSSGQAWVAGHDVMLEPQQVKSAVGYLAEHNPLYHDMYIREFLEFSAGIHRLPKPRTLVEKIIEITGLGPEQNKRIGQLSKGFRQRVGLAQALIHDPKVLILDEPTSGLDPNQLVGIRSLIRDLGKEKTVLLSTHIMQEVEAVCDRVLIINNGRLVADSGEAGIKSLLKRGNRITVEFSEAIRIDLLKSLPGALSVRRSEGNIYEIDCEAGRDLRPEVFNLAVAQGWKVLTLQDSSASLEDIFRQLTH
jgi:ABC-2 type transport system ATP-binding protein